MDEGSASFRQIERVRDFFDAHAAEDAHFDDRLLNGPDARDCKHGGAVGASAGYCSQGFLGNRGPVAWPVRSRRSLPATTMLRSTTVAILCAVLPGSRLSHQDPAPTTDTLPAGWSEQTIHGFHVRTKAAFTQNPLHAATLELLTDHVYRIQRVVPEPALAKLREIPLWVGDEDPRHEKHCMFYHPSKQWLKEHENREFLAGGVEVANATNFLLWCRDQPWMVLHELAHGYHHQVLGQDNPEVRACYDAAVQSSAYDKVLRINGSQERHYALTNDQEYFAEATEAFFGTNDFYPFVRAELKQCDPRGFLLLEKVWGGRAH